MILLAAATLVWAESDSVDEVLALSRAKITLSQAIDKALSAVPGKALSAELDDEGDQGTYLVEVVSHNQIYELTLDTQTGKVLAKKLDAKDDDDQEEEDQRD